MSNLQEKARDVAADVKEGLRKADGDESLGDRVANVGDRLGNAVKDVGDAVHKEADELSRDAAYEAGRSDGMKRPR
jgi:hypothetical protein